VKFQKGNRQAKGGRRKGAGRPTKEKALEKVIEAEVARRIIEKNAEKLATLYVKRAMKSDGVLMHAINRLIPPARMALDVAPGRPEEFYRAIEESRRKAE
jgi:hypothetical protein